MRHTNKKDKIPILITKLHLNKPTINKQTKPSILVRQKEAMNMAERMADYFEKEHVMSYMIVYKTRNKESSKTHIYKIQKVIKI